MSITYLKGDVVDAFLDYHGKALFAHGCNCFNTMNSGVARSVRYKLPELFEKDKTTVKGDKRKLGTVTYCDFGDKLGYNLYSQFYYGNDGKRYLDYDALVKAFSQMKSHSVLLGHPETSVMFIPKIGCGLAGGYWERVENIINFLFLDYDVRVYEI